MWLPHPFLKLIFMTLPPLKNLIDPPLPLSSHPSPSFLPLLFSLSSHPSPLSLPSFLSYSPSPSPILPPFSPLLSFLLLLFSLPFSYSPSLPSSPILPSLSPIFLPFSPPPFSYPYSLLRQGKKFHENSMTCICRWAHSVDSPWHLPENHTLTCTTCTIEVSVQSILVALWTYPSIQEWTKGSYVQCLCPSLTAKLDILQGQS